MADLYQGNGWRMSEDEAPLLNGGTKKAIRFHRSDTVHILALPTPKTALLLREYRPFFAEWVWMIPSGKADKETDVHVAAQRELREETGFRAGSLQLLHSCNHSETFDYQNLLFLAKDLLPDPLPQDPDEHLEVHELPLEEALERVLTCKRLHPLSALCLLRYLYKPS